MTEQDQANFNKMVEIVRADRKRDKVVSGIHLTPELSLALTEPIVQLGQAFLGQIVDTPELCKMLHIYAKAVGYKVPADKNRKAVAATFHLFDIAHSLGEESTRHLKDTDRGKKITGLACLDFYKGIRLLTAGLSAGIGLTEAMRESGDIDEAVLTVLSEEVQSITFLEKIGFIADRQAKDLQWAELFGKDGTGHTLVNFIATQTPENTHSDPGQLERFNRGVLFARDAYEKTYQLATDIGI